MPRNYSSELDRRVRITLFDRMVQRADEIVTKHKEQPTMSTPLITFNDGPLEGERRRVNVGSGLECFKLSMYDVEGESHTYEINPDCESANYVEPPVLLFKLSEAHAHAIIDYNDIGFNEGLASQNSEVEEAWRMLVTSCEVFIGRESIQTRNEATRLAQATDSSVERVINAQEGVVTD